MNIHRGDLFMSLYKYLNRIERLDALIRRKSTGPPKELAHKLDISERWLYKLLGELKEELDCPITYDHRQQSYVYEKKGKMIFGFQPALSDEEKRSINGGFLNNPVHCIYLCSGLA